MAVTDEQQAKKPGRHRKITRAVKARICREVSIGKSLRRVLRQAGMPSMSRVMEVLQEDETWAEQYARARRRGIEAHIDGIVDLADTANEKNAHAVRLKVDTRKWLASKIVPKVYGERLALDTPGDRPPFQVGNLLEHAKAVAFLLAAATAESGSEPQSVAALPAPVGAPEPAKPRERVINATPTPAEPDEPQLTEDEKRDLRLNNLQVEQAARRAIEAEQRPRAIGGPRFPWPWRR